MLSAQYLVNCPEEDHVCHGITSQEPRLGPCRRVSTLDITQLFFIDSTDLSPEDLWQNPMGSIGEFRYLDDRNLD